jgi:hypothetical protein
VDPSLSFKQPGLAATEKNIPGLASFVPVGNVAVFDCTDQSSDPNHPGSQRPYRRREDTLFRTLPISPQPFNEHIVTAGAFAVHADLVNS